MPKGRPVAPGSRKDSAPVAGRVRSTADRAGPRRSAPFVDDAGGQGCQRENAAKADRAM